MVGVRATSQGRDEHMDTHLATPSPNAGNERPVAIDVRGIDKAYGDVQALRGVDLRVPAGTVTALLGPNGAGKTTIVRILTTLLRPDAGQAWVAGYDVLRDRGRLRSVLGLAGQAAAIDGILTGRENLELVGRLYHLPKTQTRRRADELLEKFDLVEATDRQAKTYSIGMRRRLDLAASLMVRPQVLFLDEPTTGLDPRSRRDLWDVIRNLVRDGTSVLLTTQYLEEADQLADQIVVMDHGQVIAAGSVADLKNQTGGEILSLHVQDRATIETAVHTLAKYGAGDPQVMAETGEIRMPVDRGSSMLADVIRGLDESGVTVFDIALRQPTLDEVFLALTGHVAEDVSDVTLVPERR